jgi:hypothetical protein
MNVMGDDTPDSAEKVTGVPATTVAPSDGLSNLACSSTIWFGCFSAKQIDPGEGGPTVYPSAEKEGIGEGTEDGHGAGRARGRADSCAFSDHEAEHTGDDWAPQVARLSGAVRRVWAMGPRGERLWSGCSGGWVRETRGWRKHCRGHREERPGCFELLRATGQSRVVLWVLGVCGCCCCRAVIGVCFEGLYAGAGSGMAS